MTARWTKLQQPIPIQPRGKANSESGGEKIALASLASAIPPEHHPKASTVLAAGLKLHCFTAPVER